MIMLIARSHLQNAQQNKSMKKVNMNGWLDYDVLNVKQYGGFVIIAEFVKNYVTARNVATSILSSH